MYRGFLRCFTSTLNELNDVQQITYDSFELSKITKVQMMHDNFFINPGMQLQKSYYKQRTVYFLYLRTKDYSLSSWRESDLKFDGWTCRVASKPAVLLCYADVMSLFCFNTMKGENPV